MTNELEGEILALLGAQTLFEQIDWSRIADIKSLVEHGESVVAVENLVVNVSEAPGPFDKEWVTALEKIVITLGLKELYVNIVRNLPTA